MASSPSPASSSYPPASSPSPAVPVGPGPFPPSVSSGSSSPAGSSQFSSSVLTTSAGAFYAGVSGGPLDHGAEEVLHGASGAGAGGADLQEPPPPKSPTPDSASVGSRSCDAGGNTADQHQPNPFETQECLQSFIRLQAFIRQCRPRAGWAFAALAQRICPALKDWRQRMEPELLDVLLYDDVGDLPPAMAFTHFLGIIVERLDDDVLKPDDGVASGRKFLCAYARKKGAPEGIDLQRVLYFYILEELPGFRQDLLRLDRQWLAVRRIQPFLESQNRNATSLLHRAAKDRATLRFAAGLQWAEDVMEQALQWTDLSGETPSVPEIENLANIVLEGGDVDRDRVALQHFLERLRHVADRVAREQQEEKPEGGGVVAARPEDEHDLPAGSSAGILSSGRSACSAGVCPLYKDSNKAADFLAFENRAAECGRFVQDWWAFWKLFEREAAEGEEWLDGWKDQILPELRTCISVGDGTVENAKSWGRQGKPEFARFWRNGLEHIGLEGSIWIGNVDNGPALEKGRAALKKWFDECSPKRKQCTSNDPGLLPRNLLAHYVDTKFPSYQSFLNRLSRLWKCLEICDLEGRHSDYRGKLHRAVRRGDLKEVQQILRNTSNTTSEKGGINPLRVVLSWADSFGCTPIDDAEFKFRSEYNQSDKAIYKQILDAFMWSPR